MELLIAGGVAFVLAVLQLSRTFYIPRSANTRLDLNAWRFGFLSVNVAIAVGAYSLLKDRDPFKNWPHYWSAFAIGLIYLAPLTATLTTVKLGTKEYKASLQPAYDQIKDFFYARINDIATPIAAAMNDELAESQTLQQLLKRATGIVTADNLLSDDDKKRELQWAIDVYNDPKADEPQKKRIFAEYLRTRRKTPIYHVASGSQDTR